MARFRVYSETLGYSASIEAAKPKEAIARVAKGFVESAVQRRDRLPQRKRLFEHFAAQLKVSKQ